jgi:integrase/recombinase XerC
VDGHRDDLTTFLARPIRAAETRKSARSAVRSIYGWAHDTDRIPADPARRLPPVRIPAGVPRPAPEGVVVEALRRADRRARLMVMLASYAGLRCTEIARVHTRDLVGGALRVHGKGGVVRSVPMHPDLAEALGELPGGYAFPGGGDGHLTAGHVGKLLKRLLGPDWSAHTLRHRFASRAYGGTRDLRAVQVLLGHARPETTARYTLVLEDSLLAAVRAAALV